MVVPDDLRSSRSFTRWNLRCLAWQATIPAVAVGVTATTRFGDLKELGDNTSVELSMAGPRREATPLRQ